MSDLRDKNRAVQSCTFPSSDFSQAVRDWIGAATERMEGASEKFMPCGCVRCTCEDEIQCHGCGAKMCDLHRLNRPPASEGGKVEADWHPCKNCGQLTLESPDRPLYNDHLCQYTCKPASEPAKVECPNCGEPEEHYLFQDDDGAHYSCKPAQPEPVAEEMPEAVSVNTWQLEELLKYADLAEVSLRTGFHPPEFLFEPADRSLRQCIDAIKEQRDQWRTHSAQPAKVRMTKELRRALDAAEAQAGWHMDQGRPKTFDEIDAAIAAVRAQAAEAGKVRLPKVREGISLLIWKIDNAQGDIAVEHYSEMLRSMMAELDAAEGRK